jgi:hypothetical protein
MAKRRASGWATAVSVADRLGPAELAGARMIERRRDGKEGEAMKRGYVDAHKVGVWRALRLLLVHLRASGPLRRRDRRVSGSLSAAEVRGALPTPG